MTSVHSSLLVDSVCTSKSIKAAANDRQSQSLRPDELITPTDMALHNILKELLALALLLTAVPSRAQGTDELCSAGGIAGTLQPAIESLNDALEYLGLDVDVGDPELTPGGVVYTRWGRTTCPDTATLVYEGTYVSLSQ